MAVITLGDEKFTNFLTKNPKVIVKYYAGWCGSCKLFAPKFKRLANDERFTAISFADVDAENNPVARKLAGVTNLPFFAVFEKGNLVDTVSSSKEESVVELLERLK